MMGWFAAASDSKGGGRYCSAGSSPGYIHIHGICVRSKSCKVASLSIVREKALRCRRLQIASSPLPKLGRFRMLPLISLGPSIHFISPQRLPSNSKISRETYASEQTATHAWKEMIDDVISF
jgi:hypothetical protein